VLPFSQVDVFTSELMLGNPVAVVHGADGLSTAKMAAFARWTNLSETTFLLRPTDPAADYRVRIFTPVDELPFAGHPTLGSARAWLDAGGVPRSDGQIVQQCGAGLVCIRQAAGRLAFAAPALVRSDSLGETDVGLIARALRLDPDDIVDARWADNGPGWVALSLKYAVVERERRFLVDHIPDGVVSTRRIVDRYVEGTRLRLREVTDDDGTITRKLGHKARLNKRPEEVACTSIYLDDAEWRLLCQLPALVLRKVRHIVDRDGLTVAVDRFEDGSLLAEIDDGDQPPQEVPAWLAVQREVTTDERWTGARLAKVAALMS